jgi:hypothetical protein
MRCERETHRKKQPRKPVPGMMRRQDGSPPEWAPGCQWALSVTRDDATSTRYSAFFFGSSGN